MTMGFCSPHSFVCVLEPMKHEHSKPWSIFVQYTLDIDSAQKWTGASVHETYTF